MSEKNPLPLKDRMKILRAPMPERDAQRNGKEEAECAGLL